MLRSQLFQGDAILQAVADDRARISRTQNNVFDTVRRVQLGLLMRRPDCLPQFGADGDYGDETAGAVRQLKVEEFPDLPPDQIFDDVGPRTVTFLDELAFANEQPVPPPPPPPPPPPNAPFVRQDVWTIDPDPRVWHPITLAYARAVGEMQRRAATDPTSWTFQGAIHGTSQPTGDPRENTCQHGNWFFLPWHRMYLFCFENILRQIVQSMGGPADFALPYWNYEGGGDRASLPHAFRRQFLDDRATPNPLFLADPARRSGWNTGQVRINLVVNNSNAALAEPRFVLPPPAAGFGGGAMTRSHAPTSSGLIESSPHNGVHTSFLDVRPTAPCNASLMAFPNCAALDPIFWLHHANIDRLWNVWLATRNGSNPSDAGWLNEPFDFADVNGATRTMRPGDVLDSAVNLNYVYDDIPTFGMPAPSVAPAQGVPMQLVGATDSTLSLTSSPATIDMLVSDEIVSAIGALVDGTSEMFLSVEDIQAEENPGVAYGVFVNLDDPGSPEQRAQRLVGAISLFGIELRNDPDADHQGAGGMQYTFNVTQLVRDLVAAGAVTDPTRWSVTVEPVDLVESDDPDLTIGPELLGEVRIGRISLFVA